MCASEEIILILRFHLLTKSCGVRVMIGSPLKRLKIVQVYRKTWPEENKNHYGLHTAKPSFSIRVFDTRWVEASRKRPGIGIRDETVLIPYILQSSYSHPSVIFQSSYSEPSLHQQCRIDLALLQAGRFKSCTRPTARRAELVGWRHSPFPKCKYVMRRPIRQKYYQKLYMLY